MTTSIDFRTCPLCEATCGLEVTHEDEKVVRIRGDRDDVFSHGFICPKGSTLGKIDEDPDRVRWPLIKRRGRHEPATWDEAFELIESRLLPIIAEHGNGSVGVYLGNPNVHSMSGTLYPRVFLKMLGTKSIFSAATVDQMPKHVSSGFMFGHPDLIPVPDIDRTSYLLMLGANPFESNGSLATAPDWPGRLQAIRERGGKVVVVDPRRTRTADAADEHVFIRPGADALFLFALASVLFEEGLVDPGALEAHVAGIDELAATVEPFTPEQVADATGVDPGRVRRLARELASADSAAVYGRIGTHTAEFGTMASWMVDVLNVLTGNLDRPGGAMFSHAAHEQPRASRGFQVGRWQSRVKGLGEVRGELPVSTMADEILEPGPGQIRALVTIAGNPVLSTPSSDRLDAALAGLDFMVSVDIYLNETTRHADVILPGASPLRRPHYDFAFNQLAVRNIANYSPPLFPLPDGTPDEWEVLLRLGATVSGQGRDADLDVLDDGVFGLMVGSAVGNPRSSIHGRDPEADLHGDDRGPRPGENAGFPGADGPLRRWVRGRSGRVDLGALERGAAWDRSRATPLPPARGLVYPFGESRTGARATAGRRTEAPRLRGPLAERRFPAHRTKAHQIQQLVDAQHRCVGQGQRALHPSDQRGRCNTFGSERRRPGQSVVRGGDAHRSDRDHGLDNERAWSALPHGWGHDLDGSVLSVAAERPGVNTNRLSTGAMDPISGNAILNGIPVEVVPV